MERDNKSGPLERLRPSPNVEADLLEEHLGITFENKPTKIKLGRLDYLFNPALRKLGLGARLSLCQPAGIYFHKENTFLVMGWSEELHGSLHENMHAFVYQINPELNIWSTRQELRGKKFSDFTQEKGETYLKEAIYYLDVARTVHEGIAEWAAAEVMSRIGKGPKPSIDDLHEYYFSRYYGYAKLHQKFSFYCIGHRFVTDIMRGLLRQGLSVSDALSRIIKNPPLRLEQLEFPESYDYTIKLLSS